MKKVKCKAKVIYFNRLSGDGMVRLIDSPFKRSIFDIYACNLPGKRTLYPETACVYYDEDKIINVIVKYDDYALFVIGTSRPKFDKKKWEKLDPDKLAFRCDNKGQIITGLFSLKGV